MIVGVLLDAAVRNDDETARKSRTTALDEWLAPKRARAAECLAGAFPRAEHLERMVSGVSKYQVCTVIERDERGRHVRDVGLVVFDRRTRLVRMFEPGDDAEAIVVSDAFYDCLCELDGSDPPDPCPWGQVPPEWELDPRWAEYRARMSAAFGGRWWPDKNGFFLWRRATPR